MARATDRARRMSVVVITGGSRGIGARTAVCCARQGFGVILSYRQDAAAAAAVVQEIRDLGGQAQALALDVGAIGQFDAFRTQVERLLDRHWQRRTLAGLVNNAGFGLFEPIASVSEEAFDALYRVHLKGPFFLTQALLPLFEAGASIVNLTSATSRAATAGVAPYAAFKGGLDVLTRYMAKEFGPLGIRANAVSPGAIRTDLAGGLSPEFEALLAGQTALGRIGEAEEVGRVVARLLGADMGWVNGQSIEISGGYLI